MSQPTNPALNKTDSIPQVNLIQIILYFFFIIVIWVLPLSISFFSLIVYFQIFIQDDLEIYSSPVQIFNLLLQGTPKYFLVSILTPGIIILCYLLNLFLVALFAKIFIMYCNHLSPMREMIGAKGLDGDEKKDVDIYHLRGAIYRIMKWIYARAPFPWLIKWAFSFVSNNKFGKGTVLEDQYYCHEYFETGENVYIDKLAIVSSHLVDGRYGALTLKQVSIGDNVVIGAKVGICPGVYLERNSEVLFNSFVPKFRKLQENQIYHGIPVVKLNDQSIDQILKKTQEDEQNSGSNVKNTNITNNANNANNAINSRKKTN